MLKVIKTGLIYISAIILALFIVLTVKIVNKYDLSPKEVYKVYLDGKAIGNIKNKK